MSVALVPSAPGAPAGQSGIEGCISARDTINDENKMESSNSSRGLLLGGAGAVVLVALLGLAAWRRGRDATDS